MKEQRQVIQWIKRNKKTLMAAGLTLGAIIALVLGFKYAGDISALLGKLRKAGIKTLRNAKPISATMATGDIRHSMPGAMANLKGRCFTEPFDVSKHLRNLPKGHHASPMKLATAYENGFILREGQTWVNSFTKGAA